MTLDQRLIQEIAHLLFSVLPATAEKIIFVGKFYERHCGYQTRFLDSQGRVGHFAFGNGPASVEEKIMETAAALRRAPPFMKEPWSHFSASVDQAKRISVDFAYIPEDDDWVGVYMRRVSDLTAEEAAAASIPEKDWLERVHRRAEQEGKATS